MQKSFSALFLFAAICVSASQFACGKSGTCSTENMSFKNNITPLLKSNGCLDSSCHGTTPGAGAEKYTTYAGFVVKIDRVLGAIKHQSGFSVMPKGKDKIDDCDISQIEAWITQGAKDN